MYRKITITYKDNSAKYKSKLYNDGKLKVSCSCSTTLVCTPDSNLRNSMFDYR